MAKNFSELPKSQNEVVRGDVQQETVNHQSETFHNYLDDLGLVAADIKNKKVLDVGAGTRTFASYCIRNGINKEIYSLEPNIGEVYPEEEKELAATLDENTKKELNSRTVKAVAESMPLKDQSMDLILVENAMPGAYSGKGEEMQSSVQHAFDEIVRVLKSGGEARLYPLYMNDYEESRKPWVEEIEKKLAELRKDKNLEITIQEVRKLPSSLAEDAIQITFGRIIIKKIKPEEDLEDNKKQSEIADQQRIEELRVEQGFNSFAEKPIFSESTQQNSKTGDFKFPDSSEFQPEELRRIQEIESLNIGPNQKAELILVLLGAKKATNISVYQWNDPSEIVKGVLSDKCKLHLAEIKRERSRENIIMEYAVALDQQTAERLASLNPEKDHKEFGELMGFPQSAVEAFDSPEALEREKYPNTKGIIFRFSLSKSNWQEEVELLRGWSELIKKYSPQLYEELLGNRVETLKIDSKI